MSFPAEVVLDTLQDLCEAQTMPELRQKLRACLLATTAYITAYEQFMMDTRHTRK